MKGLCAYLMIPILFATCAYAQLGGVVVEEQDRPNRFMMVGPGPRPMVDLYLHRLPGARGAALAGEGGGSATEGSVLRALRWLKQNQNDDGSWGDVPEHKVPSTGLALLALTGHGEMPDSDEFGATVKEALGFLEKGFPGKAGCIDVSDPAVSHGLRALAFCESYGMTMDPHLKQLSESAVDIIVKAQRPSGLWDSEYQLEKGEDNLDASIWQVLALRAALAAELNKEVLPVILRKSADGLRKKIEQLKDSDKTGPATVCLQMLGYGEDPVCAKGMKAIRDKRIDWQEPEFDNPLFHWFFITQANFNMGKEDWMNWNRTFSPELVRRQQIIKKAILDWRGDQLRDVGYWKSPGKKEGYGTAYSTAMCCLMLESYYIYVPAGLKNVDVREEKEKDVKIDKEVPADDGQPLEH